MRNFTTINLVNTTSTLELNKLVALAMKASMGYTNPLAEIRVTGWTPELRQEFTRNIAGLRSKAEAHNVKWVFVRFVNTKADKPAEEPTAICCTMCGNPEGEGLCGLCENALEAHRGDFGPLTRSEKATVTRKLNQRRKMFGWVEPVIVP